MTESSTSANSVSFAIAQTYSQVRLLEVPEDLVPSITANKARLISSSPASVDGKQGWFCLCTDEKVYSARQVSTSNSLYVSRVGFSSEESYDIQRQPNGQDNSGKCTSQAGNRQRSDAVLEAFAKPTSILELTPSITTISSALQHISTLVPEYPFDLDFNESIPGTTQQPPISTLPGDYTVRDLFNDIPSPSSHITKAIPISCLITVENKLYRASSPLILETLKQLLEASLSSNSPFTPLLNPDLLLVSSTPEHIIQTARSILGQTGLLANLGLISTESSFNEKDTTRYIGALLLKQCFDNKQILNTDDFLIAWERYVPSHWLEWCTIETLNGLCIVEAGARDTSNDQMKGETTVERIGLDQKGYEVWWTDLVNGGTSPVSTSVVASSNASNDKKRKWHEKFSAMRKTK